MTLEIIEIRCAGQTLAHTRFAGTQAVDKAVRNATASIVPTGPGLPCLPGDETVIRFSGDLFLTGYVQDVRPAHGPEERTYDVTFVSRTIDNTEASVDHPTGDVENCTLKDIAEQFDTLGIGVECDIEGLKKAYHKLDTGQTWFQTVEREARSQGALIYDTPEGKHRIANEPTGRHAGALVRGLDPYKSGSAQLTMAGRFSEVKIRGQAATGTKAASLRPQAVASDPGVPRKRPLIKLLEGEADSSRMKKRAANEARRSAGKGTTATIVVRGFRDEKGRLWEPHFLVFVDSDWLGIRQDMAVERVVFVQDEKGTVATLSLVDPRALGGENPRGESAAAWSAPSALEPEFQEM
ncbi:hypothetical protein VQ042_11835 [Aurantimonas sp. A2-1-M11]|uniref:phage baseplate assembly protein n=1 Tax=Aurantimonas sp. A2-1-M11 TaxID=3113712 RepID=UPI002F93FD8F